MVKILILEEVDLRANDLDPAEFLCDECFDVKENPVQWGDLTICPACKAKLEKSINNTPQ